MRRYKHWMYNRQIYKLITLEKYDIQRHFKDLSMFANKSRRDIITCTCRRHSLITIFKDKKFHIRVSLHQPKELGEQIKQNWIPFYSWRNYQRSEVEIAIIMSIHITRQWKPFCGPCGIMQSTHINRWKIDYFSIV